MQSTAKTIFPFAHRNKHLILSALMLQIRRPKQNELLGGAISSFKQGGQIGNWESLLRHTSRGLLSKLDIIGELTKSFLPADASHDDADHSQV